MDKKPVSTRMESLLALYDMQTGFFAPAVDGISDADSHQRLGTRANHIAWLAGSLVEQRAEMVNSLGGQFQQQPFELFKENKGIQDNVIYPGLNVYKSDWEKVSPLLRQHYLDIDDAKLDSKFEMPGMSFPFFDMITFTLYREANIIGQIALWRRLLNYDAMKYM